MIVLSKLSIGDSIMHISSGDVYSVVCIGVVYIVSQTREVGIGDIEELGRGLVSFRGDCYDLSAIVGDRAIISRFRTVKNPREWR